MYIKNVRYQSNLYIFIFSAMLSWTTHLKPDSEPPKELLSVDALLNIGMFRLKSLMKTLIWLALKSTFQRWHGITLKTSLVLKKKRGLWLLRVPNWSAFWRLCCVRCLSQLVPSKMYWTTFCAEKNLLVLPKSLNITLNIINLIHCIYLYIVLLEILNCIW